MARAAAGGLFLSLGAALALGCGGDRVSDSRVGRVAWKKGQTVVCLGTSLTFGFGQGCKVWPVRACAADSSYPTLLEEHLRLPVINMGLATSTAAEGLRRMDEALARDPALVILEFGANELLRDLGVEAARADLRAMIGRLRDAGAAVALLSFAHPDMVESTPRGHYLRGREAEALAFHAMLVDLAAEFDLPIVENLFAGIWGEERLMFDDTHPNGRGYVRMEENIRSGLEDLFRASGMLR